MVNLRRLQLNPPLQCLFKRMRQVSYRYLPARSLANSSVHTHHRFFSQRIMLTIAGVLLLSSMTYSDGNTIQSTAELAKLLKTKLSPIREKLRSLKRQHPPLNIQLIQSYDRKNDEWALDMDVHHDTNIIALVKGWADILGVDQASIGVYCEQMKAFYANPRERDFGILSTDSTSKLLIKKLNDRQNVSISIVKQGGFSVSEVESIIQGYKEAFERSNHSKLVYAYDARDISDYDIMRQFLMDSFNLPPRMEDFFVHSGTSMERNDDIRGQPPAGKGGPSQQQRGRGGVLLDDAGRQPQEVLAALGVEVFDRVHGLNLNWDAMAGYNHVKSHILDAVINPLKYPAIYEGVAKKTRVVFEDNRTKAILFEGPPGTGKTLCARIIASQCDRPLVVLKLESFVSKWYGESEKNLSKILDACDALGNAIIFLDEVDAVAQSRDAGGGGSGAMHEASRRVLSTILQRIEGFEGKGKSLLVCATNRKHDLDSALLSRFDLTITFDLPDFETRREIFRRYAKQFDNGKTGGSDTKSKNSAAAVNTSLPPSPSRQPQNQPSDEYSKLARLSEGLSCREIKESCENAERARASAHIQQYLKKNLAAQGGGSSSGGENDADAVVIAAAAADVSPPTFDDYAYWLHARSANNNRT